MDFLELKTWILGEPARRQSPRIFHVGEVTRGGFRVERVRQNRVTLARCRDGATLVVDPSETVDLRLVDGEEIA
jgi:hypothetical protein